MNMFQGLGAEAYDRSYTDGMLLRRVLGYFKPNLVRLRVALFAVVGTTILGVLQPIIVSRALDALRLGDADATRSALLLAAAVFAFAIINWILNYVRALAMSHVMSDLISELRRDAFDAVIGQDLSFFDRYASGKIISRISNDTQEINQVSSLVSDLFSQVTLLVGLTVYLFTINVPMTFLLLLCMPIVVGLGAGFRKLTRWVTRRGFRAVAEVNQSIQEMVAGMRIAKNFRQEAEMYRAFRDVNQQAYRVGLRRAMVVSNIFPTLNVVSGLLTALLLYVGAIYAGQGVLPLGGWYLFVLSIDLFWFPLTNLASFWSTLQGALSALERVFALIDSPRAVMQLAESRHVPLPAISKPLDAPKGVAITFHNVDFRYGPQMQVLKDFNLSIAPGESVAFVGHTGAGKSSLIKLITRFYEFQSGEISLDGVDIRTLDLQKHRERIGLVTQVPFLFSGSVADNVRYARPELTDDEVSELARSIGDGEWLDALPDGIHTQVGERGMRLSLGQRQLVALARVLAQRPAIFMLDEATASIDPFTERHIQQAINAVLRGCTSILVAHRLSTVRAVDRILVLKDGAIIEHGSHDQLLSQGGHYASLYQTYFRHQIA